MSRGVKKKPPPRAEPRGEPAACSEPLRAWHATFASRVGFWLLPVTLLAFAYRQVVDYQFVGDARFLIEHNDFMRGLEHFWANLAHNYFWSSSGNIIPYWRPATKGSWLLEYQLFGGRAGYYLLVQVLWHAVAVAGVCWLGVLLGLQRRWAAACGVIYALHPVAIAPVCLLMARSDVVAAAATLWAVLAFVRWQAGAGRYWIGVHLGAVTLALASKEAAVVIPGVLGVATWLAPNTEIWKRRLLRLAPASLLTGVYLVTRRSLLTRDAQGLADTSLEFSPLRLFAGGAKYLQSLFPLRLESAIRDLPVAEAKSGGFLVLAALTWLCVLGLVLLAWRRRDWVMGLLLVWGGLALAPVLVAGNIHVPAIDGKLPLADRWAYHALGPASLAAVRAFLWGAEALKRRWLEVLTFASLAVWSVLILLRAEDAHAEFGSESGLLDNEDRAYYFATPEQFRTKEDHCRYQERQVVRASQRADAGAMVELVRTTLRDCGETPERNLQLLEALVRTRGFSEALPVAVKLTESPPRDRRGHGFLARLLGLTFLGNRQPEVAERWLLRAHELGNRDCTLLRLLGEAARDRGQLTKAAERLEAAYACGKRRDPSLLIAAATWIARQAEVSAEERALALRLLETAGKHTLSPNQAAQARQVADLLRR